LSAKTGWKKRLLSELQEEVPGNLKRLSMCSQNSVANFKGALENLSGELSEMRERKAKIEAELGRLTATAAQTGPSPFWLKLSTTVNDSCRHNGKITVGGPGSLESHLSGIRQFVTKRLSDLQGLLSGETTLARVEIQNTWKRFA